MPSVETLQYLAEVLEIPLQSLISKASPLLMPELLQENDPLHDLDYAKSSLKIAGFHFMLSIVSSHGKIATLPVWKMNSMRSSLWLPVVLRRNSYRLPWILPITQKLSN